MTTNGVWFVAVTRLAWSFLALLCLVGRGRADDVTSAELLRTVAGRGGPVSAEEHRDALHRLEQLPVDARAALAAGVLLEPRDAELRAAALRLLQPVAGAREVPLGVRLVVDGLPEEGLEPPLVEPFVRLVASVHARDRDGTRALVNAVPEQPLVVQALIVEGIAEYVHQRTAEALGDLLMVSRELRVALLVPLAKLIRRLPDGSYDRILREMRGGLDAEDAPTRREAALAVGWLRDDRSLARLTELLDDPEVAPRNAALWSLRRISGLQLRGSKELWRRWLHDSEDWWLHRSETCFAVLRTGKPPEVLQALQEIGRQNIGRERVIRELEAVLGMDSAEVVATACAVLERLEDTAAVPMLSRVLLRSDPTVATPAHRALVKLTGAHLPPDYSAWRSWMQDR
ncbi:MAG: hypothetical protein GC161_16505 [Planctomycetaceae bacterium]|nr:hypothetical protein [Planctomycetaceae bacterium]